MHRRVTRQIVAQLRHDRLERDEEKSDENTDGFPGASAVPVDRCRCRGPEPAERHARAGRAVDRAAQQDHRDAQGRRRQGRHPRCDPAGGAPREDRPVRRGRRARSGDQGADDEGLDLPHLFDEQADHVGGGDGALRGGQVLAGRARLEVHPAAGRPQGGRREARSQRRQAYPRAGAGPARHDHPGSLPPHLGPDLRLLRQRPREEDVRRHARSGTTTPRTRS